jgi:hypothetical protein
MPEPPLTLRKAVLLVYEKVSFLPTGRKERLATLLLAGTEIGRQALLHRFSVHDLDRRSIRTYVEDVGIAFDQPLDWLGDERAEKIGEACFHLGIALQRRDRDKAVIFLRAIATLVSREELSAASHVLARLAADPTDHRANPTNQGVNHHGEKDRLPLPASRYRFGRKKHE